VPLLVCSEVNLYQIFDWEHDHAPNNVAHKFFYKGNTIVISFSSSLFVPWKLIAVWLLVRYRALLNLFLTPAFPKLSKFLYLVLVA